MYLLHHQPQNNTTNTNRSFNDVIKVPTQRLVNRFIWQGHTAQYPHDTGNFREYGQHTTIVSLANTQRRPTMGRPIPSNQTSTQYREKAQSDIDIDEQAPLQRQRKLKLKGAHRQRKSWRQPKDEQHTKPTLLHVKLLTHLRPTKLRSLKQKPLFGPITLKCRQQPHHPRCWAIKS